MEKLISEIEAYAAAHRMSPSSVLQAAVKSYGGSVWARWKSGGNCNIDTADKIRAYMAANPPPVEGDAA